MARSRAHGAPRAAPTPAAAGTRHAAAEPTMGYSASNAVRGEAHRPGQAAAPDRRPRTADQAPEEEVLRPAALHRQVHHRAIHQLERAQSQTGSELDRPARPPLLLLLLLAAQNAPCSAAGAGPICAVLCVCGRAGVIYRGSAERSGRRLASGSEKVHRSNLLDPMPTLVLSRRSRVH